MPFMIAMEETHMFAFNHFNFNVLDLERSMKFYREALGLAPAASWRNSRRRSGERALP